MRHNLFQVLNSVKSLAGKFHVLTALYMIMEMDIDK